MRFLGLGNGSSGIVDLSSYTPIVSSCSGTSGSTSLTATNASFSAGQRVFIHQSRGGANVGLGEDNTIESYVAGTITLVHPLERDYTDSGAEQAQVVVVPQASKVTGSITVPAWDGDVGGLFVIACNGDFDGTIDANGKGYIGGLGYNLGAFAGYGEGTVGPRRATVPGVSNAANGNGGGASNFGVGSSGGHATVGNQGTLEGGSSLGVVGAAVGSANMSAGIFPGGGAAGSWGAESLEGGDGGGIIIVYARKITSSASITANGSNGQNHVISSGAGASGGAGGSILIKSVNSDVSGTITATGGTGGTGSGTGSDNPGVAGANGRIRIESCSVSGETDPVASKSTGGHSYCGGGAFIF